MTWNRAVVVCVILGVCCALSGAGGCDGGRTSVDGDAEKRQKIDTLYSEYEKSFPNAPRITVDALLDLMSRERVVLVDVREARERAISVIPGAISLDAFRGDEDAHRSAAIVLYCTVGYRGGPVVEKLRGQDVRAFNLVGGILSWVHAGRTVVSDGTETRRVHVYNAKWNLVPAGYEAVW